MTIPRNGWFQVSETRWIPVTLVRGPYLYANAVRLRTDSGQEIITEANNFHDQTPKQKFAAQKREAKKDERKKYAKTIIAVLTEPRTLDELSRLTKSEHTKIWNRINYWPEFEAVKNDGGKYHL